MWCNDIDWLTSGEVDVISTWSAHVHYVEARWELTCEELTLFMQLEAKYTCGASLTPYNRDYIHSTCYIMEQAILKKEHSTRLHAWTGYILGTSWWDMMMRQILCQIVRCVMISGKSLHISCNYLNHVMNVSTFKVEIVTTCQSWNDLLQANTKLGLCLIFCVTTGNVTKSWIILSR